MSLKKKTHIMYDHIDGIGYHITGNKMVFRCGGIGYEILIPFSSLDGFRNVIREKVTAWTHLVVKEDSHTLYGFFTVQERDCFRLLIQVSGVGPTTALTILSAMSVMEVMEVIGAIGREDVPAFKAVKAACGEADGLQEIVKLSIKYAQ